MLHYQQHPNDTFIKDSDNARYYYNSVFIQSAFIQKLDGNTSEIAALQNMDQSANDGTSRVLTTMVTKAWGTRRTSVEIQPRIEKKRLVPGVSPWTPAHGGSRVVFLSAVSVYSKLLAFTFGRTIFKEIFWLGKFNFQIFFFFIFNDWFLQSLTHELHELYQYDFILQSSALTGREKNTRKNILNKNSFKLRKMNLIISTLYFLLNFLQDLLL